MLCGVVGGNHSAERLTVHLRQRCSCLGRGRLTLGAYRSPFVHCDCREKDKDRKRRVKSAKQRYYTNVKLTHVEMKIQDSWKSSTQASQAFSKLKYKMGDHRKHKKWTASLIHTPAAVSGAELQHNVQLVHNKEKQKQNKTLESLFPTNSIQISPQKTKKCQSGDSSTEMNSEQWTLPPSLSLSGSAPLSLPDLPYFFPLFLQEQLPALPFSFSFLSSQV